MGLEFGFGLGLGFRFGFGFGLSIFVIPRVMVRVVDLRERTLGAVHDSAG